MKRVISILSVGHSGSTLLDIALGQFSNTFSTGELKHLTWQYYRKIENIDSVQKCTCGKYFDDCKVWSKVILELAKFRNIDKKNVPEIVPLKHFDSLSFFTDFKKDKFLRYFYKWNLYHKAIPGFFFSCFLKETNKNNIQLFNSIYKQDENIKYIIDSSKDIIRFNELRKKKNIFPIVLIRDINEVMKSKWVKASDNTVKVWLNYYNKSLLPIIKKLDENDFHVLSYEKFIVNPQKFIKELSDKIDINVDDFSTNIPMKNYHIVAGNGMRYTDEVKIRQKPADLMELKKSLTQVGLNKFYIDRL